MIVLSWLALALLSGLAGCDRGGRDPGAEDSGVPDAGDAGADADSDADTDTDTDADTDTDTSADAGLDSGPDGSFRDEDAGDTWQDPNEVSIEGECGNDCGYNYGISGGAHYSGGDSRFSVRPGGEGTVVAEDVEDITALFYGKYKPDLGAFCAGFAWQQLFGRYELDAKTMALEKGEVSVVSGFGDTERVRAYTFTYSSANQALTYTVREGARTWQRTLSSAEPPLVAFNMAEYPLATWGSHSPLFVFLVDKVYPWSQGGEQRIPVFCPEIERILEISVSNDPLVAGRLTIELPPGVERPVSASRSDTGWQAQPDTIVVDYQHGIPVHATAALDGWEWSVQGGPGFELNLPAPGGSADTVAPPYIPTSFTASAYAIPSGDITLSGELNAPASAGAHPLVILLPGWSNDTRLGEEGALDFYRQLGAHLASAGYLVLSSDARGTGSSGGGFSNATLSDLAGDARAMIAAAAGMGGASPPAEVFLLAVGEGAHVAAEAARTAPAGSVDGLVLISPLAGAYSEQASATYRRILVESGFTADGSCDETDLSTVMDSFDGLLAALADGSYPGATWRGHTPTAWQSVLGADLLADAAGLPPTLILSPAEDHLVPPEASAALEKALEEAGIEATNTPLPGLTHALTQGTAAGVWPEHGALEGIDSTAVAALTTWLDAHTGGGK